MIWVDFNYLYTVSWHKIHTYDAYYYETSNITQEDADVNELGAGAIWIFLFLHPISNPLCL